MQVIAGKFNVKPEKREELIQLTHRLFEPSRAEEGCISYNFYEDSVGRNSFLFFEEWMSKEAIDQHFQSPHFIYFMENFPDLIDGAPSIKIYEVKEVKEI